MTLPSERGVWSVHVDKPTLVLGSTQKSSDVRENGGAIGIAPRRSGGGAVFVHPVDSVWVDITIPRNDVLWDDDVSRSMLWLGDVFVRALGRFCDDEPMVYRGAYSNTPEARAVCFAGLAPGEVTVGQRKLIGISQRRTRDGARFQCIVYRSWAPEHWSDLLHDPAMSEVARTIAVATVEATGEQVVSALVEQLPL